MPDESDLHIYGEQALRTQPFRCPVCGCRFDVKPLRPRCPTDGAELERISR